MVESKRKVWVDELRAMAIFFVVFVHLIEWNDNSKFIYNLIVGPIMLPLFFAISGYVFNDKDGKQKYFFKSLLKGIVIPGLFLSLIWLDALLIPFKGFSYFTDNLISLISGKTKWFFIAYLISVSLFFYTRKFFKSFSSTCVVSFIIFVIGLIMAQLDIFNFAMINRACIAQGYFLIGFAFKTHEIYLAKLRWSQITCGIVGYILLCVISYFVWPQKYMDVHLNQYYNLLFCIVMVLIGCYTAFLVASNLTKESKIIAFIGQNTFVIYFLHGNCFVVFQRFLSIAGVDLNGNIIMNIIGAIFSIVACCGIALILNIIAPELIGKKRKKT